MRKLNDTIWKSSLWPTPLAGAHLSVIEGSGLCSFQKKKKRHNHVHVEISFQPEHNFPSMSET
jgi:hypothetical protein